MVIEKQLESLKEEFHHTPSAIKGNDLVKIGLQYGLTSSGRLLTGFPGRCSSSNLLIACSISDLMRCRNSVKNSFILQLLRSIGLVTVGEISRGLGLHLNLYCQPITRDVVSRRGDVLFAVLC